MFTYRKVRIIFSILTASVMTYLYALPNIDQPENSREVGGFESSVIFVLITLLMLRLTWWIAKTNKENGE